MANRRMFSKTVTNSSHFLGLPLSAQALYYHIGMNTDDDGYCEKLYVMRLSLCQPSDIQELIDGRFIYQFNDNILLDLFFDENNQIRKDRKKDSHYAKLYPKSDICQPDGNQMAAQVRLVEVRLGKDKEKVKKENPDNKSSIGINNLIKEVYAYLNEKLGSGYKISAKKNQALVKARHNEGFTLDNFKTVIDTKHKEWSTDPNMMQYLRPETLFGNKFEGYLNQIGIKQEVERPRGREVNSKRQAWIDGLPPFIDIGTEYLKPDKFAELWDKTPKDQREPLRDMIQRAKDEEANRGGKISKVDGLMGGMLKGKTV